jgi:hypothetical protein
MSPNNYKQLLIRGIILGSIIFFSNHLTSSAQDLPEKTDKVLNIVLPSAIPSGQEQGRQQESRSSVIQGEIVQQQNREEEKGIEILQQQEDKVQEVQEELEEDDTNIDSITTSNIIKEEKEEEQDNSDQGNSDYSFGVTLSLSRYNQLHNHFSCVDLIETYLPVFSSFCFLLTKLE